MKLISVGAYMPSSMHEECDEENVALGPQEIYDLQGLLLKSGDTPCSAFNLPQIKIKDC